MVVSELADDQRYEAVVSRDARFDGWFIVGVTSTGIYCRPSCPTPIRPKRSNVRFFATAAAAQRDGFRACKRCRPDATPGSPAWDLRADLVGRAMRLIADGVVDRDGVGGLAGRLAVSERHLHRMLVEQVGAGPIAIARAHRAQTARVLVETTDLKFADVAFAAGFSSIRQFNDTMQAVFAQTPRELRGQPRSNSSEQGELTVRLAYRAPLDAAALRSWVAHRSISGLQFVDGHTIVRSLRLPNGGGVAHLDVDDAFVGCTLQLDDIADLATAVERCRRFLDLDADPLVIESALESDPVLAPVVRHHPGLRAPGSVDGLETAVFAILGQQISVRAACHLAARLVERHGSTIAGTELRCFPDAAMLAGADLDGLGMTRRTQAAIRSVATLVADGLSLDPGADRLEVREALLGVHGIGPWTADYVGIRALRDPDVMPVGDLIVRRAAGSIGLPSEQQPLADHARRWSPWRTYVAHHLWALASSTQPNSAGLSGQALAPDRPERPQTDSDSPGQPGEERQ